MSEAIKRYLELQRALGGNEIILSGAVGFRDGRTGEGTVGQERTVGPSVVPPNDPAAPPTVLPSKTPAARNAKHWSSDAPPIPTVPGIVVPALLEAPSPWSTLEEVAATIAGCRKCFLCQGRTRTVPGEGNREARLMFVGEGPGQTEDETGRPFVGRAGELLTRMIEAIELQRDQVFIANVVKCRPPQNRKPLPDEIAACSPYLERQIGLIRPAVLVALGATAAEAMLGVKRSLTDLRGRVHSYRGIPLVVTYHPAALLRNPNWKKPTWDDIRIARQLLDR